MFLCRSNLNLALLKLASVAVDVAVKRHAIGKKFIYMHKNIMLKGRSRNDLDLEYSHKISPLVPEKRISRTSSIVQVIFFLIL